MFISVEILYFQILQLSRLCLSIRLFMSTNVTVNSCPVRALIKLYVHCPIKSFHPIENLNLNHTHRPNVLNSHRVTRSVRSQILVLLLYTEISHVTSSRLTSFIPRHNACSQGRKFLLWRWRYLRAADHPLSGIQVRRLFNSEGKGSWKIWDNWASA